MGNILIPAGTEEIDGLISNIPFPFVVVHSGNMTRQRLGYCLSKEGRSVNSADDGCVSGWENARKIAWSREMRRTLSVDGYAMVNMGSKTAAR